MTAEWDGADLKVYPHHDEHSPPVERRPGTAGWPPHEEGSSGIRSTAAAGLSDARPKRRRKATR